MNPSKKSILLITYYWPPSGGPGVQRWLKTIKYLESKGLNVHVYTPENPERPSVDDSLEKDIPKSVSVVKRKIWEPYSIYNFFKKNKKKADHSNFLSKKNTSLFQKAAVWIRSNVLIPDARIFWVRPSANFLKDYIKEHQIETIITTGPPHSMHLIGLALKNKNSTLNWIADFRDPWTFIDFIDDLNLSEKSLKKHQSLEEKVIKTADTCVTVSPSWKETYEKMYGVPFELIYNGYDHEDFKPQEYKLPSNFTIAHIGTMNQDRSPSAFWEILTEIKASNPKIEERLQLVFRGKVNGATFHELEQLGIPYEHKGYVPHETAINTSCSSHILLLPVNNTNSKNELGHIPGKFFEYLATGRPILCFGNKDSDIKPLLEKHNQGIFIDYNDISSSKALIETLLLQTLNSTSSHPTQDIPYTRKKGAEDFYDLITSSQA